MVPQEPLVLEELPEHLDSQEHPVSMAHPEKMV